ncbi:formyl transferase [Aliiglaciecola lipolytica]|uniref:Formyl transferase N-terminal domain-containing protein n=1 Tax=Aliiglaciecola lipolytica E3 TaxID=1127673 RepID=K6Y7C1_9ALTE|nr:formyl transferase [Aliiglaciecola lipolytica]GAC14122.1 hypothetical protein GLIP_1487 [Aliiglaciecola lipolytica E3]
MRITILANRDLASNLAINLLLQQLPQHKYRIFLSAKVGNLDNLPEPLKILKFAEQTLFNQIVYPLLETSTNTNSLSDVSRFKSFAELHRSGITVSDIPDINSPLGQQTIAAQKPELVVSIRFGQILKDPVIGIPEFGIINLHSGTLPDYRGVMATFWAMLRKEQKIGTTLHYIDSAKIDAGQIIATTSVDVDYQRSYLSNVLALYPQGINSMVEAVNYIANGEPVTTQSMDLRAGNYFSFPNSDNLNQFFEQGNQLVNFDEIPLIVAKYMSTETR